MSTPSLREKVGGGFRSDSGPIMARLDSDKDSAQSSIEKTALKQEEILSTTDGS